jgi:serine/threonine protein phosphatase PrpC
MYMDSNVDALSWYIGGASIRGVSHVRNGKPNQDALAHWQGSERDRLPVIVAVADGHGGARHFRSAEGSRLAVQAMVTALREVAPSLAGAAQTLPTTLPERVVGLWRQFVEHHLDEQPFTDGELEDLAASAGPDAADDVRNEPRLAYGATLLGALVTERHIVLSQIGDGDIIAVSPEGEVKRPVGGDARLIGNLTTSICGREAEHDFRTVVVPAEAAKWSLLLLSTDGYANSFKTDRDFLQVGYDLLAMINKDGVETVQQHLPEILEHASASGSGDDITLGMLYNQALPGRVTSLTQSLTGPTTEVSHLRSISELSGRLSAAQEQLHAVTRHASKMQIGLTAAIALLVVLVAVIWARPSLLGLSRATPAAVTSAGVPMPPGAGNGKPGKPGSQATQPRPGAGAQTVPGAQTGAGDQAGTGGGGERSDAPPASAEPGSSRNPDRTKDAPTAPAPATVPAPPPHPTHGQSSREPSTPARSGSNGGGKPIHA